MACLQMGLPMHQETCTFWIRGKVTLPVSSFSSLTCPVLLLLSREFGTVMERIYARLGTLLRPAPPHKLPSIDNILNIATTIELMRPLANRQPLDQLFNLFVASRGLVLEEGIEDATVQEPNQATMRLARSTLTAAWTHPT